MSITTLRASLLHFANKTQSPDTDLSYFADGLLVLENDKILDIGSAAELLPRYGQAKHMDYSGKLIIPGLIDSHMHFPQTEMLACYGEQLLSWLENYTFPIEAKFADGEYAAAIAEIFLQQLLKNGTTTALVYSSVHKVATDALFRAAKARNMLLAAGKVCMDRNCPDWLQDCPDSAYEDSKALIEAWHNNGRLKYALTPRFAPTSTEAQMQRLGELARAYPDIFIQTHLSENKQEIEWVKSLYPQAKHYLDVYDHYHMVRPRAVFGHCVHLEEDEWQRIKDTGASIAFCPTSNLFLGSGLFDLAKARELDINMTLATDVGGGTSFNMLRTLGEAYKICQLKGTNLSPLSGLYMMTQGAACALQLEHSVGNLNPGTDADFVVLDYRFDELTQLRLTENAAPEDIIFALTMLGDDRATQSTWVAGKEVYQKQ